MLVMGYTSFIFYPRWNKLRTEAAISADVSGYYWYLPSLFIYHDLKKQGFADSIVKAYSPTDNFEQGMKLPNGNYVMKYSSGMAVMYLPFFTAAHLFAGFTSYPRDGFSLPYQLGIQLGGFLMAIIGLFYFRKLLLLFYDDKVVAIVLLLLVIGTNYLMYSVINVGMSHNWLFTLYVFLLLNTVYFYRNFQLKYAIRIGLIIGLATLARPTELISCLIPLLWGMEKLSFSAIKQRLTLLIKQFKPLIIAASCAVAVLSIQLIYWKYVSGHWFVYSYGTGQKLYFRSPNFFNYTFSYNTGWLLYTPMMVLSFVGLLPFLRNGKNKVAITLFFLLNYYIICSWNIWWYGGRAMVQSYPILMFPIASLVSVALTKRFLTWVLTPFLFLFTYMNIWYTYQCHGGGLYDNTNMTREYYWRVAGRWQVPDKFVVLKDYPEYYEGPENNKVLLYQNDFEQDTTLPVSPHAITGNKSLELNDTTKNAIEYKFPWKPTSAGWLVASADFHNNFKEYDTWKMTQLILRVYKADKLVKSNLIRVHRLMQRNGETINASVFMNINNLSFDSVGVSLWNGYSSKKIWIDNVKVYSFQ